MRAEVRRQDLLGETDAYLAERSARAAALIAALFAEGLWPPVVPSMVLIECLTGEGSRDAVVPHCFLRTCDVADSVPVPLARRAAWLRRRARTGSAVDALVTAVAEPGGTVLTGDLADLRALARHASDITIEAV